MTSRRTLTRRSFLARIGAGGLVAGYGVGTLEAEARPRRRVPMRMAIDSDPRDPARPPAPPAATSSRGRVRTGFSDRDTGPEADPANYGRRGNPRRRAGISDNDSGPAADPIGQGHGPGRPTQVQRFVVCPGNSRCPRRQR